MLTITSFCPSLAYMVTLCLREIGPNRNILFQTHLSCMTIYDLQWNVNVRWRSITSKFPSRQVLQKAKNELMTNDLLFQVPWTVADRGHQPLILEQKPIIWNIFFVENCLKMKKIGPRWRALLEPFLGSDNAWRTIINCHFPVSEINKVRVGIYYLCWADL